MLKRALLIVLVFLLDACAAPAATPVPPTAVPIATATSVPPTTAPTSVPQTATAVVATATAIASPTVAPSRTIPPTTAATSAPLFGWVYEGEVMVGNADLTVMPMADGTYRAWYGRPPFGPGGQAYLGTAISADGLKWTDEGNAGIAPTGLPRVIRLPDGRLRLYYTLAGTIAASISTDGKQWTPETVTGFEVASGFADGYMGFGIVARPQGGYRMYYTRKFTSDKYPQLGISRILSAVSVDGLNWQMDTGVRIDSTDDIPRNDHPDVMALADGTVKMFWWGNLRIMSATSKDGLAFENITREDLFGNDPAILKLSDGTLRVYTNWKYDNAAAGIEQQRMWAYRWREVPFVMNTSLAPVTNLNQNSYTVPIRVTGKAGERVTVRGNVQCALSPSAEAGGTVTANPASGTVPFETTLTLALTPVCGGQTSLVLFAGNGQVETSLVREFFLRLPMRPGGAQTPGIVPSATPK